MSRRCRLRAWVRRQNARDCSRKAHVSSARSQKMSRHSRVLSRNVRTPGRNVRIPMAMRSQHASECERTKEERGPADSERRRTAPEPARSTLESSGCREGSGCNRPQVTQASCLHFKRRRQAGSLRYFSERLRARRQTGCAGDQLFTHRSLRAYSLSNRVNGSPH